MRRANIEPDQIDQTIMGHARQAGNGPNTGRQVSIRAGVPEEVSAFNVNIACGSGMKATQLGAQQIMLGEADVVLVGGMENMTRVPFSCRTCASATAWATPRPWTRCTATVCSIPCAD
jgi:acetyl-CoA C-acetyltransferase